MSMTSNVAVVSGGFDPIHAGHVAMINEAHRAHGDVVIILNSDKWLTRKKGRPFMHWDERAAILLGLKGVLDVIAVDDGDGTVCNGILQVREDYSDRSIVFCNGGDRKAGNTPETALCEAVGIQVAWDVGGGKQGSSSGLLAAWNTDATERPWGEWMTYRNFTTSKLKELVVKPGGKLSLQRHEKRSEFWFVSQGAGMVYTSNAKEEPTYWSGSPIGVHSTVTIPAGQWHQLHNTGTESLHIIEIQYGELCIEEDIERASKEHLSWR